MISRSPVRVKELRTGYNPGAASAPPTPVRYGFALAPLRPAFSDAAPRPRQAGLPMRAALMSPRWYAMPQAAHRVGDLGAHIAPLRERPRGREPP